LLFVKETHIIINNLGGMQQHIWLKHYATNQKVMGLIPDEVTGFSNSPNPSSLTMALGSTQPLNRNKYQESSWGKSAGGA
jgi:hypothetical protein